jgi:uncharacterized repeat protein (TIGR03803 family)
MWLVRLSSGRFAAFIFGAALLLVETASAQVFSPLHVFSTATGSVAPLVQGADGTLYGVSAHGGASPAPSLGTVFKLQPDGNGFTILYSFTGGADGSGPSAALVISGNTLYGTAKNGGTGKNGTVFKLNTDGTDFTTIYSFSAFTPGTNSDGANPVGNLVLFGNTLYGTASVGGSQAGAGTVFKVNTDGSGFATLHNFSGVVRSVDGAYPHAGLFLDGTTLYGTTQEGGTNGYGTVFKIDTSGADFATLHAFAAPVSGLSSEGSLPEAGVVFSGGTLYGTTSRGGAGHGTVFRLNTDGSGFTTLYNFQNGPDGSTPLAALVVADGTLYGTASSGGNFPGWGTVFKLKTDGSGFTNLYNFDRAEGKGGTGPAAGLLLVGSTLYGTTANSAGPVGGTVFKLNTDGSAFSEISNGNDGAQPQGGLVLSGDSFFGTTSSGGSRTAVTVLSPSAGTIFKLKTNGTSFATLHTFGAFTNQLVSGDARNANADGARPVGTLASSGGVLYGTTQIGGSAGVGTIFRMNTDGTGFTNLYNFTNSPDGAFPAAGVVLAGGALYGTTELGGANAEGTVFKINTDGGGFTTLYNFSAPVNATNSDGTSPMSGLALQGETLYGTTHNGGPGGGGTLFKINTDGTGFTRLYSFNAVTRLSTNSVDGANPVGGLVIAGSTIYGTTSSGGTATDTKGVGGPGTAFQVNTDGTGFVKLHTFTGTFGGFAPKGALALAGGRLYGTAANGGNGGGGTVFQMNADGSDFTTLHTFPFVSPQDTLGDLLAIGGTIYGTSEFSVPGSGSVFAITPTAAPSVQFTAAPSNGTPPQTVQFTAPPVDDKGNTLIQWKWDFGDGAQFSGAANPTHTYTNEGPFTATLIATNSNGTTVIGSGPEIDVLYPTAILNGGFETGTFENWTRTGGVSGVGPGVNGAHSGTYGARLQTQGSAGFLSQTLTTTPGAVYVISFWSEYSNPRAKATNSNELQLLWNGAVILDKTNLTSFPWTNIQVTATATATTTVVQFGYRSDGVPIALDDVTVSPVTQLGIAGITLSGANLVLNGMGGVSGQTYEVLMGTDLPEPVNEWTSVATQVADADGNFSVTVPSAVDANISARFYILHVK